MQERARENFFFRAFISQRLYLSPFSPDSSLQAYCFFFQTRILRRSPTLKIVPNSSSFFPFVSLLKFGLKWIRVVLLITFSVFLSFHSYSCSSLFYFTVSLLYLLFSVLRVVSFPPFPPLTLNVCFVCIYTLLLQALFFSQLIIGLFFRFFLLFPTVSLHLLKCSFFFFSAFFIKACFRHRFLTSLTFIFFFDFCFSRETSFFFLDCRIFYGRTPIK